MGPLHVMYQRRAWQHDEVGTVVPLYQVSGALQSLTTTGLVDVYGLKEGSDRSSHSDLLIGSSFTLPGVSIHVASQLSGAAGQQLLAAVKSVYTQFELATAGGALTKEAKELVQRLQDMHFCIVALDDNLDEPHMSSGVSVGLEDCRQWLKQMQGYVLHITKQVQACMAESPSDASSISSMDEAGSSNSSAAGTAACDTAWRVMCQDAAEVLSRVADQMETGGAASSDFDSPRVSQPAVALSSRLVAKHSRLSYSNYWSKKIAL